MASRSTKIGHAAVEAAASWCSSGCWQAGIVFLDPPYTRPHECSSGLRALAADPPPLVIAQHSRHQPLENFYGALDRTHVLKQGDNQLLRAGRESLTGITQNVALAAADVPAEFVSVTDTPVNVVAWAPDTGEW